MTREHLLMVLGALVLISPWSGLPLAWLEWVLLVLGLAIIGTAYALRLRERHAPPYSAPPPPPTPPHQPEEAIHTPASHSLPSI